MSQSLGSSIGEMKCLRQGKQRAREVPKACSKLEILIWPFLIHTRTYHPPLYTLYSHRQGASRSVLEVITLLEYPNSYDCVGTFRDFPRVFRDFPFELVNSITMMNSQHGAGRSYTTTVRFRFVLVNSIAMMNSQHGAVRSYITTVRTCKAYLRWRCLRWIMGVSQWLEPNWKLTSIMTAPVSRFPLYCQRLNSFGLFHRNSISMAWKASYLHKLAFASSRCGSLLFYKWWRVRIESAGSAPLNNKNTCLESSR